jgi:hypothetical protein
MVQSGQPTVQGSNPTTWAWFSLASPQYWVPIPLPGHGSVWPAHSTGFLSLYLDMVQSGQPIVQGSYLSTWTWFSLANPQYWVPIPLPGHGSVWPAHSTGFLSLYLDMVQSGQPIVQGSYPSTWTWFSLASPQYRVPIPLPGHGSVWSAHSTGFLSLYLDMVQSGQPTEQGSYPFTWTWFSLASPQYKVPIPVHSLQLLASSLLSSSASAVSTQLSSVVLGKKNN